jgi:hypothetical protein
MIYKYSDIDIKKIKFGETSYNKLQKIKLDDEYLEKNVYYIDIYYNNDALYIQLPKTQIYMLNLEKNLLKIKIDEKLNNFIKKLEEYIIMTVYKNSEMWFNGKCFTMNKIVNSIIRNTNYIKKDIIMTLTIDKHCKFFNQYGINICSELTDIISDNMDTICIIKMDNLQFLDNKFTYNMVLEQAKIYNIKKILEYSILDESENTSVSIEYNSDNLEDEYYKKE